ncbi:MAG: hypothetical protein V4697_01925 [Patescibacteria group bacterium]
MKATTKKFLRKIGQGFDTTALQETAQNVPVGTVRGNVKAQDKVRGQQERIRGEGLLTA